MMNPTVTVNHETLQAVFDIAVNSMDFGSGFLEESDVVMLREVAVLLGVSPRIATPANVVCRFEGHQWTYITDTMRADARKRYRNGGWSGALPNEWICIACGKASIMQPPTSAPVGTLGA